MTTNFPTSLDSLTNPLATDPLNNPSHADQHANVNDAVEALEAKVGVDGSAVTTSLDYKVAQTAPKDAQYVALATNSTLTNERVLTAGTGITITDAGAGSTVTVANSLVSPQYVTLAADSTLTNERVLTAGTGITVTDAGAGGNVTVATSAILPTVVDAKGDLIVATAADTVARLAVGATNGFVLTVDSAETTGLKWAAAAASGETISSFLLMGA